MMFIIGASGRLGQALVRQYGPDASTCVARAVYADWGQAHAQDAVEAFFAPLAGSDATVLVASGLLDPTLDPSVLWRVNVDLPRAIVDAGMRHGVKVLTIGTVMEALLADHNPYIRSKRALGQYVAQCAADGAAVAHIRVHTLYGAGMPSPFMFLGQLHQALVQGQPFNMTLGRQLREYHHVDDDACAIRVFDQAGARGVLELSHGAPLSLATLAHEVFDAFGAAELLQLGALPEPAAENYDTILARNAWLDGVAFRATLPAVVAYLRQCGVQQRTAS